MKLLERICLIQFFLYEQEDLDVGRNTAFLGPNGTGKTCLLDAVQAVVLGADATRMHFNAQADGKRRGRTLRSYCLGVYDQSGHGSRAESNTYIALVFRDEATGEVVTAGVALSAREDSPDHTFHGLFILPGVDLRTTDLIVQHNGRPQVLPWRDAQFRLKALVSEGDNGAVPVVTQNREEFLRKLLLDHLAARGDHPNVSMFRNAFQRSLQLKVMDDLSTALRDHLIEGRDTNIKRFRDGVTQFRKMRDLVTRMVEQIAAVTEVNKLFSKVRRLRAKEVNHKALGATLQVELQGSVSAQAEDDVQRHSKELSRATAEAREIKVERDSAKRSEAEALNERGRDPAHQARGQSALLMGDRERAVSGAIDGLREELMNARQALASAAAYGPLVEETDTFVPALTASDAALKQLNSGAVPDVDALTDLANALARATEVASGLVSAAGRAKDEAVQGRRAAAVSLERAKDGRSQLHRTTEALQAILADEGIEAIPACDLVEISDARWQPVIEAYLRRNVESLLVRREDEERTVSVQRGFARSEAITGAKIVLPSKLGGSKPAPGSRYAAALVRGEHVDAVAYVRGELGSTECVGSNAELRAARRAFTVDGMMAMGSTIERRKLPTQLQIGRRDAEALRADALRRVKDADEAVEVASSELARHQAVVNPLLAYGSADRTLQRLVRMTSAIHSAVGALTDARRDMDGATSSSLAELDERVRQTGERYQRADTAFEAITKKIASAETSLDSAKRSFEAAETKLRQARTLELAVRDHPLFDASETDRLREAIESGGGEEAAWIDACNRHAEKAGKDAATVEADARHAMSTYRVEFGVNADVPADWEGQARFGEEEHLRLTTSTLAERQADSEAALQAAEHVFRTDVVQAMLAGFERVDDQVNALNSVLKKAPEFSNRERYRFRYRPVDLHKELHAFLLEAGTKDPEDSLWSEQAKLPVEFRAILEASVDSPVLVDSSPLYDYRRFFSYDVEIRQDDEVVGLLSKRFGPGSGGEHRTPLYVIFGAALAAAYGNLDGRNAGGGLMLLDEAFDKMDATNVRAVADYLNTLGLQLLMAGPETDQPKLSGFLNLYYDMSRHGSRTIHLERYWLNEEARALLASDNPLLHPELLEQEMERIRAEQSLRSPPGPDVAGDAAPVG